MKAKSLPQQPTSLLQPLQVPPIWSAVTTAQQQQLARLFAPLLRQMRPTPKPQEGASHE